MMVPNHNNEIVPYEYFESNLEFAKLVVSEYADAKEKNCSWFGPKNPFYISKPKLITNAHAAKRALTNSRIKESTLNTF